MIVYIHIYTMISKQKRALQKQLFGFSSKISRVDRQQNQRIRRLERGLENSFKDSASSLTPGNTAVLQTLSFVAVGDTNVTREGNKIIAKRLIVRLRVIKTVATTDVVRFIVFVDKEQHGVIATTANLTEDSAVGTFYNKNNRQRFRILKDITMVMSSDDSGGTGDIVQRNFVIPLRNMAIHYVGTAADQASQGKNNIYSFLVLREDTTKSAVQLDTRLIYQD